MCLAQEKMTKDAGVAEEGRSERSWERNGGGLGRPREDGGVMGPSRRELLLEFEQESVGSFCSIVTPPPPQLLGLNARGVGGTSYEATVTVGEER